MNRKTRIIKKSTALLLSVLSTHSLILIVSSHEINDMANVKNGIIVLERLMAVF